MSWIRVKQILILACFFTLNSFFLTRLCSCFSLIASIDIVYFTFNEGALFAFNDSLCFLSVSVGPLQQAQCQISASHTVSSITELHCVPSSAVHIHHTCLLCSEANMLLDPSHQSLAST